MDASTRQLIFTLLPTVLNLVASASSFIGSAGAVPKYLQLLATIIGQAEPAYTELVKLKELVERMVIEQREPTEDEWSDWQRRSDDAHRRIQDEVIWEDA